MSETINVHFVSSQTVVIILSVLAIYLVVLIRRAVKNKLDLYDVFMLSSVALITAIFMLFPGIMLRLTRVFGVQYPFLLLFGALILAIFVFVYSIVRRVHDLNSKVITLVQESSILRNEIEVLNSRSVSKN